MSKHTNLTWPDRFALIDHYAPSTDDIICSALGISSDELSSARQLHTAGSLKSSSSFDVAKYGNPFDASATKTTATTHLRPESATKRAKTPQKRGRKGTKISTALLAIPLTPISVSQFQETHPVSVYVLRQANKRFLPKLDEAKRAEIGTIQVKTDRATKQLMIWREVTKTTV